VSSNQNNQMKKFFLILLVSLIFTRPDFAEIEISHDLKAEIGPMLIVGFSGAGLRSAYPAISPLGYGYER